MDVHCRKAMTLDIMRRTLHWPSAPLTWLCRVGDRTTRVNSGISDSGISDILSRAQDKFPPHWNASPTPRRRSGPALREQSAADFLPETWRRSETPPRGCGTWKAALAPGEIAPEFNRRGATAESPDHRRSLPTRWRNCFAPQMRPHFVHFTLFSFRIWLSVPP